MYEINTHFLNKWTGHEIIKNEIADTFAQALNAFGIYVADPECISCLVTERTDSYAEITILSYTPHG